MSFVFQYFVVRGNLKRIDSSSTRVSECFFPASRSCRRSQQEDFLQADLKTSELLTNQTARIGDQQRWFLRECCRSRSLGGILGFWATGEESTVRFAHVSWSHLLLMILKMRMVYHFKNASRKCGNPFFFRRYILKKKHFWTGNRRTDAVVQWFSGSHCAAFSSGHRRHHHHHRFCNGQDSH